MSVHEYTSTVLHSHLPSAYFKESSYPIRPALRFPMDAPLLDRTSDGRHLIGADGDYLPARGLKAWWTIFCIESAKLWELGGPIAIQIMCQFANESICTMFVGHLGDLELAAFSIALCVISTLSIGFLLGMGSALETLCGQTFGAGKVEMLGIYMQRSMIVLFASCFLLLPIYVFAAPILKLLGQQDDVADLVEPFALMTIPQLFSLAVCFPSQKFLQAQSKVSVLMWISFFAMLSQIFICWLFIHVFGWGTVGAAVAFDVTSCGVAIAQYAYVIGWCKDAWRGYSWSAFDEIWAFVKLSLASAVMLCLETWYLSSIVILAGHLNNSVMAVGSLSICMYINGLQLVFFMGINAAISVRVSNELGEGHPRRTKYSVFITIFQSLLIGIICMITIIVLKNHIAVIFTSSEEMQHAVAHLSSLLGITMLLNSIQPVISGIAIGGGWQSLVAYINLASYYLFGLPLGYILGYVADMGVLGLWSGMVAGMTLQTFLLILVLCRTNWNQEVEKTTERLWKWGGQGAAAVMDDR